MTTSGPGARREGARLAGRRAGVAPGGDAVVVARPGLEPGELREHRVALRRRSRRPGRRCGCRAPWSSRTRTTPSCRVRCGSTDPLSPRRGDRDRCRRRPSRRSAARSVRNVAVGAAGRAEVVRGDERGSGTWRRPRGRSAGRRPRPGSSPSRRDLRVRPRPVARRSCRTRPTSRWSCRWDRRTRRPLRTSARVAPAAPVTTAGAARVVNVWSAPRLVPGGVRRDEAVVVGDAGREPAELLRDVDLGGAVAGASRVACASRSRSSCRTRRASSSPRRRGRPCPSTTAVVAPTDVAAPVTRAGAFAAASGAATRAKPAAAASGDAGSHAASLSGGVRRRSAGR